MVRCTFYFLSAIKITMFMIASSCLTLVPLTGVPDTRVFAALLRLDKPALEARIAVMGKVTGRDSRHPDQGDRMMAHFGDASAVGIAHVQMAELLGRITTQKIAQGEPIGFLVVDELPFDDFAFTGLGPFFGQGFCKKGPGQLGATLLRIRACQPVDWQSLVCACGWPAALSCCA